MHSLWCSILTACVSAGKPTITIDSSNGSAPFFTNYGIEQGLMQSAVLCTTPSPRDSAAMLSFQLWKTGTVTYGSAPRQAPANTTATAIVSKMMKAGADAFFNKDTGKTELMKALEKVTQGEKYISPVIANNLITHLVHLKNTAAR